jgi:hypothetical protein
MVRFARMTPKAPVLDLFIGPDHDPVGLLRVRMDAHP